MKLPPLDTHAHVALEVPTRDLESLGAAVLIATRSADEFERVRARHDLVSVWGLGCHPSLVGVQRSFDSEKFRALLEFTPYVAEVGLDGDSRVPLENQTETLKAILDCVRQMPRVVSLHSFRATTDLLRVLDVQDGTSALILHWWLGTREETTWALELGCYFSVNYSMIRSTSQWRQIPLDRLLVETDHPSGDRFSSSPRQPGRVQDVERALGKLHGLSVEKVRLQLWQNFAALTSATSTAQMLPIPLRKMIAFAQQSQ